MKCPSCGRLMLNMVTFFRCSNGFCDYEEDIETLPETVKPILPSVDFFKPVAV